MSAPALELRPSLVEVALDAACQGAGGSAVQAHTDYQERPLEWITERLGVRRETLEWSLNEGYEDHEWDGDEEPWVQLLDALVEWKNVAVESGTGTGKTFLLACIILWFLACWKDSIVVTQAPKEDQLLDRVWKEIERLWPYFQRLFPQATLMASGRIRMYPDGTSRTWQAKADVVGVRAGEEVATKAQGEHAVHMLIITEETPGMHPAVMKANENTRTAPHNLQVSVGNPDHEDDELHQFCLQPDVVALRVSAKDHPNVVADDPSIVPGAVSSQQVVRRKLLYRNMPALYDSRVRGISPKAAFGVALKFNEAEHLETLDADSVLTGVREQDWGVWSACDLGDWRTSILAAVVDRAGRMRVVAEAFLHESDYDDIALACHELLSGIEAPEATRIHTDRRDAQSVSKLNRALDRLDSPYRAVAVSQEAKARKASVTQINTLLGRGALAFRRGLGSHLEWRLGLSVSHQGDPMHGSRLMWEMRHWRYPEPREGQAQRQDPDDDSADGADAIAALRYLVMTWFRSAPWELPEEVRGPNVDTGLERLLEHIEARKRRERRQHRKALGRRRPL